MVRVALESDRGYGRRHSAVRVVLDPTCGCEPCCDAPCSVDETPGPGEVWLTVRQRTRTGFSDNGNPVFEWTDTLYGLAASMEVRSEFNAQAGMTNVVATAVMLNPGGVEIHETAAVASSDGDRWRVTKVTNVDGMLTMALQRIDQVPTGQPGS